MNILKNESVLEIVPHGFKVDIYRDGTVFSQILLDNYIKISKLINTQQLQKITLRTLHPLDTVVTKIGRLDDRDIEDIGICIKRFKLRNRQIATRANLVGYVGSEDVYHYNLQRVLKTFFSKSKGYQVV